MSEASEVAVQGTLLRSNRPLCYCLYQPPWEYYQLTDQQSVWSCDRRLSVLGACHCRLGVTGGKATGNERAVWA